MSDRTITVRPVRESDREWLTDAVAEAWGSDRVVSRGRLIEHLSRLPGFVAERAGDLVGFAFLRLEGDELEVIALRSLEERQGVGTALLDAVQVDARRSGCSRVWLVTTNDNLDAIRFYQRRGWEWVAFHRDAVANSRRLKPEIPQTGAYGIEIRHEIEFEAPKT